MTVCTAYTSLLYDGDALALIGSDVALDVLETYADDTREGVRKELLKAWDAFDRKTFARRILSHIPSLKLERVTTLDGLEYAIGLTTLDLSECEHLTTIAVTDLPSLTTLNVSRCEHLITVAVTDLPSLIALHLSWYTRLTDISPLANLTKIIIIRRY